MLLHSFRQFEPLNSFVFKEGGEAPNYSVPVGDESLPASAPGLDNSDSQDSAVEAEADKKEKTPVDSEAAKAKRDAKVASARKKAKRGKEVIRKRLDRKDILDEEEQAIYVPKIREAIEVFSPDRWYEFVKKHQEYNGNYKDWNKDFCNLLVEAGQATPEEVKDPKIQRKYVAGLQYFLTDHFSSAGVSFELNDGKKINKFTYVDGLLGGYTISVLGAYLTSPLYGKKKAEWTRLEGGLHDDFVKGKGGRKKEFGDAVGHLRSQLENADYTKAGLSTVQVNPGEPVDPNVATVPEDGEVVTVEGEQVEVASVEEERIKNGSDALVSRMTARGYNLGRYRQVNRLQKDFEREVQEIYNNPNRSPDISGIGVYLNNIDGSWPQIAFDDYEEMWGDSNVDQKQLDDKLMDSLNHLKSSVDDYHRLFGVIFKQTKEKYGKQFAQFLKTHSLPKGFNLKNTNPINTETIMVDGGDGKPFSHSYDYDNPQYVAQRKRIEKTDLEKKDGIDGFYQKFFDKNPTKVIANWGELQASLKDPKENSTNRLLSYFNLDANEKNQNKIMKQINQVILLGNMYLTDSKFNEIQGNFRKDLRDRFVLLDGGYSSYYENYQGRDDEFISELLSPQDKLQPHIASTSH